MAFGVCVLVFIFLVMAQHWQSALKRHSGAIRKLATRLQALEAIEDPEFRRKLGDSAPAPLEQVFTFSLGLGEKFLKEELQASPQEIAYSRANGRLLGAVKIERWRSHSVATVHEILPQSKSAEWASRSIDVYSASDEDGAEPVTLWELPLASNAEYAPEAAPSLELRLVENTLELRALFGRFGAEHENGDGSRTQNSVFFVLPLDATQLAAYRQPDAQVPSDAPAYAHAHPGVPARAHGSWVSVFSYEDEARGVEWQLCIRDLRRKEEWNRWRIWEQSAAH